jgi:hypothetical protein
MSTQHSPTPSSLLLSRERERERERERVHYHILYYLGSFDINYILFRNVKILKEKTFKNNLYEYFKGI